MIKSGSVFYMHRPEDQAGELPYMDNLDQFEFLLLESCAERIPFFERPKGAQVRKLIGSGKLSHLEVRTITCIGVDFDSVMEVINELTRKKIRLVCRFPHLENFTPSMRADPTVETLLEIYLELDRAQYRIKTAATNRGIERARQENRYKGRKRGTVEPVEKFLSKPRIVKIMQQLSKGRTTAEIAIELRCGYGTIDKVRKLIGVGRKKS